MMGWCVMRQMRIRRLLVRSESSLCFILLFFLGGLFLSLLVLFLEMFESSGGRYCLASYFFPTLSLLHPDGFKISIL